MEEYIKLIKAFKLPRFNEIPNIELYMDQLLAYIEGVMVPICDVDKEKPLTTSMVNNYVKQGVIPPTCKKRYSREHIAYLIVICILKQIYSITELGHLIAVQNSSYTIEIAYDYLCTELENTLNSTFSNVPILPDSGQTDKPERLLVRNSAIAFAHKLYTQKLCEELYKNLNL
ncbi:MAG: DUF1836 domain-containing protein [Oscillospiraceae bacterium]